MKLNLTLFSSFIRNLNFLRLFQPVGSAQKIIFLKKSLIVLKSCKKCYTNFVIRWIHQMVHPLSYFHSMVSVQGHLKNI